MTDPGSLVAGLSSLKAAIDIAKTISDARDSSKLLAVRLELQGLLLEAQEAQSELSRKRDELEDRVEQLEAWDAEKQRYELVELAPGVIAFSLKAEAEPAEPAHKLCANCFGQGRKGYLQSETRTPGMVQFLVCHSCGSELVISGQVHPEHRGGTHRPPGRAGAFGRRS